MELDFVSIGYLFLRLAPFILVCFFSLSSIFNQDLRGLVYVIGLVFTCIMISLMGESIKRWFITNEIIESRTAMCNLITIGGAEAFSTFPLSQITYGYSMAYLGYFMQHNKRNTYQHNIPTIVFFCLLTLFDLIWNKKYGCFSFWQCVVGFAIAFGIGIGWAAIIRASNSPELSYIAEASNSEVCSVPARQTFKCDVYQNGKLLAGNIGGK
uniref:Phosphatidic acid phosphatase type 2/haloperoxidase domain-containing protein n=1 Tax=viral metagenome TaxID=1070528 RepID=A0A6C0H201_9ZZZZ